jgi:hypothetical protein
MGCYDKLLMVVGRNGGQKEGGDKNKAQPQLPRIPRRWFIISPHVATGSPLRLDLHHSLRNHFY